MQERKLREEIRRRRLHGRRPVQNGHCAGGVCCDQACDGACVSCAQAGSPGVCRPVAPPAPRTRRKLCHNSRDTNPTSCGDSGTCDGNGGCASYAADTTCRPAMCTGAETLTRAATCNGTGICQNGTALHCDPFGCSDGNCKSTCASSADCATGQSCDTAAMSCGLKGIGQSCASAGECGSGVCADGLCCNQACDGACRSCALASSPGICKNVAPGGADPHRLCAATTPATCGTDGLCDGNGGCRLHVAGTVCAAGVCATSTRTLASTCDGRGTCVAGYTTACAPYRCNGSACFVSCSSDAECLPPLVCLGGACGLKPSGVAARPRTNAKAGAAPTASAARRLRAGPARPATSPAAGPLLAAAGADPDPRGTCADNGAASCGTDGRCDGVGGCHRYAIGTACTAATCVGSTRPTPARATAPAPASPERSSPALPTCAARPASASTSCATSADCIAPAQCLAGSCGQKPQGAPCATASECGSGFCTDGVCCGHRRAVRARLATSQASRACARRRRRRRRFRGMCPTDPPASCGLNGKCNGGGGCQRYVPGSVCLPRRVRVGERADARGDVRIHRHLPSGWRAPTVPTRARPEPALPAVRRSDCVAPYVCRDRFHRKGLGTTCASGGECDSGHCTDGVCCGSASCPMCKACNIPGFAGTCANLPAGTPDPGGACPAEAPTTCGRDGKCDGSGACRLYVASTVCAPATCRPRRSQKTRRPATAPACAQPAAA